ncbi:hypothetical protein HC891_24325 [Candidatus Gracilibacteria bacterium]|nr:hypothetical protein [Candidatus Gracilibacteria bacterium]
MRVYFERPWFSSGDGELLAVVYAEGILDNDRIKRMRPFVTLAGGDPTMLGADTIFGINPPFTGVRVSDLTLDGAPEQVKIHAVPVEFDAERKLWSADLDFFIAANDLSANPLVRLALARYQPNARPNCELSRVVLADFVQLPNQRSAVATFDPYDPSVVRLAVAGVTHKTKTNALGGALSDRTQIEVSVEMRLPHIDGELGWTPAPPSLAAINEQIDNQGVATTAIWAGTITLPRERKPGDFRLVIREFERYIDDAAVAEQGIGASLRPGRLIYAEIFEV